jgi:serine protease inhibitor
LGTSARSKPRRSFEMIVDRPFFFAICDYATETILFMGSVEEPKL